MSRDESARGVKLNRTGYLLIAFFTIGGAIFFGVGLLVSGAAALTFLMIGVIWVLGVVGLLIYARYQGKKAEHDRWLFESGLKGTATLVKASSNTRINDQPVLKMVLDIQVPGQVPRRIHKRILMSDFAAYRMQPGVVLPVHVNPDTRKPGDLLVRW